MTDESHHLAEPETELAAAHAVPMVSATREQLLREYDALENAIDWACGDETWRLADWLAMHVPPEQGARNDLRPQGRKLTLVELSERGGRTVRWLQRMRAVAIATAADRIDDVPVRVYEAALASANGDLAAANAALCSPPASMQPSEADFAESAAETSSRYGDRGTHLPMRQFVLLYPEEEAEEFQRHLMRLRHVWGQEGGVRRLVLEAVRLQAEAVAPATPLPMTSRCRSDGRAAEQVQLRSAAALEGC
jgi:hypothetical protein